MKEVKAATLEGRIFVYFKDGKDEAIVLDANRASLKLFPWANNKVYAEGVTSTGNFTMSLMHPSTLVTLIQPFVSGYSDSAHFYANEDTKLSYEDSEGKVHAAGSGSAKVSITFFNGALNVGLTGDDIFT